MSNSEMIDKNEEGSKIEVFSNIPDTYYFENNRLFCGTRGEEIEEVSFHDFAEVIKNKYGIDMELPFDELSNQAALAIKEIGFECYATGEIRRLTTFVIDHRDDILAKEKEDNLDHYIENLFKALEDVRKASPENDWNILCNDEILVRESYAKTKKLGTKDNY